MANTGNSVKDEAIREIAAASLTTSYQALGGVFLRDAFRVTFKNATNGDVYLSTNGTTNNKKFPPTSGCIWDDKTNDMYRKAGTQFSVKWDVAPGAPVGWVGLEVEFV